MFINNHAPIRRLTKREIKIRAKPWITKGLKVSIAIKNRLYKSYLKSKNDYYFSKYKTYRNKLKHLLFLSKKIIIMITILSRTKIILKKPGRALSS